MVRIALALLCLLAPLSARALPSFGGLGTPTLENPPPPGLPELSRGRWTDWTPDGQYATGYEWVEPPITSYGHWYATRWSASEGVELLEPIQEQTFGYGISDDGRVIAVMDMLWVRARRWEEGVGMTVIPRPHSEGPGGGEGQPGDSVARGISGDGSAIVGGTSAVQLDPESHPGGCTGCNRSAMVWYDTGEVLVLGDLPGGLYGSMAYGASFDGSVVFGIGRSERGEEAFVWDAERGIRAVFDVLSDVGLDVAGWDLGEVVEVSNDGLTIQGNGINPSGEPEAWVAVIPEPSTALLVSVGLMALATSRRGVRRCA